MKEKQIFTNLSIDELKGILSDVVSEQLRNFQPNTERDTELIKADEACELLSISKPTLYKYMREGRIKGAYYLGTRLLFNKRELLSSVL